MQKVINDYLAARQISQSKLASELKIDKGHFSRILSGQRPASVQLLKKLAKKTGKTVDELIKG